MQASFPNRMVRSWVGIFLSLRNPNIGIKHVFLCINICWTLSTVLKPEPKRWGVKQMLVYQKTMLDHYYFLKSFCRLKTLEKPFEKFILYCYNRGQKHEGFTSFEKNCSRAKTYVILTSLNYVHFSARYCWWCQFLWLPRLGICKVQKPCINSTWITWLIHGLWNMAVNSMWHSFLCNNNWILFVWNIWCYPLQLHVLLKLLINGDKITHKTSMINNENLR